jgi:hypothetical protein
MFLPNSTTNQVTQYRQKEDRLIGFSNDFRVTVIRYQNADAMVLVSALMRAIHPPPPPPPP